MPIAHVEEGWQMAEFYNNKVIRPFLAAQILLSVALSWLKEALKYCYRTWTKLGGEGTVVCYPLIFLA